MARIYVKRTLSGFDPADEPSREAHHRLRLGHIYRADIIKPRNYKHHCLCLALLSLTFENQERYTLFKDFRDAVALEAGHVDTFVTLRGEQVRRPRSISYEAIPDDIEFGRVMSAMMDVCARILGGMDLYELQAEVAKYALAHYGVSA
jgi:Protein of unknown function (DUF1367)